MKVLAVILAALVIYSAGIVTGAFAVKNRHVPERPRERWSNHGPPSGMLDRVLTRMDRELDLTPDQREKVKEIIAQSKAKISDVTQTVNPVVRDTFQTMRAEINAVLTPEQQAKFGRIFKRPHMGPPRNGRGGRRGPDGPNFERRRRNQPSAEDSAQPAPQDPASATSPQSQPPNQN